MGLIAYWLAAPATWDADFQAHTQRALSGFRVSGLGPWSLDLRKLFFITKPLENQVKKHCNIHVIHTHTDMHTSI